MEKRKLQLSMMKMVKPVRVDTIVISTQHHPDVAWEEIDRDLKEHVIKAVVPARINRWRNKILH